MKVRRLLTILIGFAIAIPSVIAQETPPPKIADPKVPTLVEKVEAKPGEVKISYEKWKYPNGLTLVIHEDHSDPIAHIEMTYHVGSARESLGKSGFAHFFEHMMFQGSENVEDEEHFRIVSEAGGSMNGTTNRDRTNYFETVPSNYLETALWLEADRMGFLVDAVTKEKFEVQRATVKNEKSQNVENQPYGMIGEKLGQNLYPNGHPYSWPTIGYVDDLDRVDESDLKDFFMRWYGPNNAYLVVSGDVDPEEVKQLTGKYFGSINKGPEVRKQRVERVVLPVDKYVNFGDPNIYYPLTSIVFPSVPNWHKDEAALDMLADIMGGSRSSIFYQKFVKSEKAIQASVSNPCSELAGEFSISVLAFPNFQTGENNFDETEDMIRATLKEFEEKGFTDEELERAKVGIKSGIIGSLSSVSSKASSLTSWSMHLGNRPKYNLQNEIDRYENVTKEDVWRVYNKYIKGKHAVIVNVFRKKDAKKDESLSFNPNANISSKKEAQYEGLTYTKPKDDFDRSVHPTPKTARAPQVPDFYRTTLSNGIKVIGTEHAETPRVVLFFEIKGGHLLEDGKNVKPGTSVLLGRLMNESTKNYSSEEISAKLELLGSSVSFGGGGSGNSISVNCYVDKLDETLALLEEKLLNPGFNEDDFKREKKSLLQGINNQKTSAQTLASKNISKLLYGDIPLGTFSTGTYEDVEKIKLDDLKEYYNKYYSPKAAGLVIVGNISQAEIMPKLEFLNKWKGGDIKMPEFTSFPEIEKTEIYLVDRPHAPQSIITIAHLSNKYDAFGDYYKSNIMNYPLGGAFNSRINLNLREDKGFTYGARSGFSGSEYPGTFGASASVRKSATDSAIVEFMKEIKAYREGGITDKELAFTKSSILQRDALRYETLGQKAGFLGQILEYDLPKDYRAKQTEIVNSMTKDEINELAKKLINPDKMVILVVGDKYDIKKPLEELGYGKVKELKAE